MLVAVAFGLVVLLLERPDLGRRSDFLSDPLFPDLEEAEVTRIEIEHLMDRLLFERENQSWRLWKMPSQLQEVLKEEKEKQEKEREEEVSQAGLGADTKKIEGLLEMMAALQKGSLISTNSDQYGRFHLVEAMATAVRLYDKNGELLAKLWIGKASDNYQSSFVRRDGDSAIYQVNGYLAPQISSDLDYWKAESLWKGVQNKGSFPD